MIEHFTAFMMAAWKPFFLKSIRPFFCPSRVNSSWDQGDQIGRIFAFWAIAWSLLKIRTVAHIIRLLLPRQKCCISFGKKWIGLTFGRFFSQTHLVTLAGIPPLIFLCGKWRLVSLDPTIFT
jgi:hypothetical protein